MISHWFHGSLEIEALGLLLSRTNGWGAPWDTYEGEIFCHVYQQFKKSPASKPSLFRDEIAMVRYYGPCLSDAKVAGLEAGALGMWVENKFWWFGNILE